MANVNEMNFNQLSTVLNAIVSQATGATQITPVDTSQFVSVAQIGLKTGYDALNTAISQVLSRTIFAIRPYSAKFEGLRRDSQRWGNHVRKINIVDSSFENDDRIQLVDGESIDQQRVKKPDVIQTNFYGQNVYQKSITIYKDQLDVAFTGPDEFGRFISMLMQNIQDQIEQAHENTARACIGNLIGGTILGNNTNQVVKLITEYNSINSGTETLASLRGDPQKWKDFIDWVFARVGQICAMLSERSYLYHANLEGKNVARHTPMQNLNILLSAGYMFEISSRVLPNTFNENLLRFAKHETVNFWQSIESPNKINVKPAYFNTSDGSITTASNNLEQDNIFGVLFDDEAAGFTTINQWSAPAPFNARGGYTNTFWHFTERYYNDFMENTVVLLLE